MRKIWHKIKMDGWPRSHNVFVNLKSGHASLKSGYASLKSGHASLKSGHASLQSGHASLKSGHASRQSGRASLKMRLFKLEKGNSAIYTTCGIKNKMMLTHIPGDYLDLKKYKDKCKNMVDTQHT